MTVPPIFMFGMERSGTTLLSMMIGAHPQIAVPLATTGMWIDFGQDLVRYNNLDTREQVERLLDAILAHERIKLWDAALDREKILADLSVGDYGAIVCRLQSEYARAKNKPYWANIDIATLDHMEAVNDWVPNARFVQIVRDGRDVALSHQTMPYGSGTIAECARAWDRRVMMNAKMGKILGPERYFAIRFEDLVGDTENTLRRLCAFLGVSFDQAMLHYGEMVNDKIPQDRQWLWPNLSSPPEASKIEIWRHKMTRTQRIVFEGIANETLKAWHYEVFEPLPKSLRATALELWYLLIQGGRLSRLKRKFGLRSKSLLERNAERRS